jgi:hypothetical protein
LLDQSEDDVEEGGPEREDSTVDNLTAVKVSDD